MWGIGMVCAIGTAYQAKYHRLAALILMGGAGLVVCITFAWLSAPDLALTQLLVEIVTTVLILLGLRWLPKRLEATPKHRDGCLVAPLARSDHRARRRRRPFHSRICDDDTTVTRQDFAIFLERAQTEGGGANVVNVILVDFRGLIRLARSRCSASWR